MGNLSLFQGFSSQTPLGTHREDWRKLQENVLCGIVLGEGNGSHYRREHGLHPEPSPSISFMEQKLSPLRGQAMNTIIPRTLVKTLCSWEEGKATRGRGRSLLPFSGKEISVSPEKSLVKKQEI